MTADELLADGNRLFRDDLYWAALLRYNQASEAGMDSPLLHFNSGVAHYKAQQYERARASLLESSRSPSLEAISLYNLGLVSYAEGDLQAALDFFRQARDQQRRADISALARRAIAKLNRELAIEEENEMPAAVREQEIAFTHLGISARVGAGLDNNVFRSPAAAYINLADPNLPLVTPDRKSVV